MTYMDFLQRGRNQAEILRKKGHSLAFTGRNVHGKICSLSRTLFFNSLERLGLEYPSSGYVL